MPVHNHRPTTWRVCLLKQIIFTTKHHTAFFPFGLVWMWDMIPGLQRRAVLGKVVDTLGGEALLGKVGHWGSCWSFRALPDLLPRFPSTLLLSDCRHNVTPDAKLPQLLFLPHTPQQDGLHPPELQAQTTHSRSLPPVWCFVTRMRKVTNTLLKVNLENSSSGSLVETQDSWKPVPSRIYTWTRFSSGDS